MTPGERFSLIMFGLSVITALMAALFRYMMKVNDAIVRQTVVNESFARHDKANKDQLVVLLERVTDLHVDMERRVSTLEGRDRRAGDPKVERKRSE